MSDMTSVLIEAADRILGQAYPTPPGGFDTALWNLVADAGLDKLLMPEDAGGSGDAFGDAAALAVRLGARGGAVPLIETMVANWCLAASGLPVPEGPKALHATAGGTAPTLDGSGNIAGLDGSSIGWEPVAGARVVLAERDGKPVIACIETALPGDAGQSIAGEPLRCVSAGVPIRAAAAAPWPMEADRVLGLHAMLKAAAIAGAAETAVELAIEYANVRVQFGRRIGAFQAIQHMIARMAAEVAATSAAAHYAALSFGAADGLYAAAVAKGRASEAAGTVAAAAHQVHGAIGFTAEHSLHRFTRRLWSWREDAGNESYWYDRIGRAAFADGRGVWDGMTKGLRL